ncbi:MAG: hypothetical protein ACYTFG_05815, partial [Planctomycetota bacterium]
MKIKILIIAMSFVCASVPAFMLLRHAGKEPGGWEKCPEGHESLRKIATGRRARASSLERLLYPPYTRFECEVCGYSLYRSGLATKSKDSPHSFDPPFPEFAILDIPEAKIRYERRYYSFEFDRDHLGIRD